MGSYSTTKTLTTGHAAAAAQPCRVCRARAGQSRQAAGPSHVVGLEEVEAIRCGAHHQAIDLRQGQQGSEDQVRSEHCCWICCTWQPMLARELLANQPCMQPAQQQQH